MLANVALPALSGYYTSLLFFPVAVVGVLVVEAVVLWLTLGRKRWWWCADEEEPARAWIIGDSAV